MGNIIKGIPASRGLARGIVKIIKNLSDAPKFNSGDILVTHITDPTMVTLMAKAGAIVCDIGSITSHPSIVSRELGIPCVVNTKIGTRELSDGMDVSVNGLTGEIEIFEHSVVMNTNTSTIDTDIDSCLDSYVASVCAMDFSTFDDVTAWYKYDPLVAQPWLDYVFSIIHGIKEKGLNAREVARLFPNTSEIRGTFFFDMFSAHFTSFTNSEKMELFCFYNDMLKAICVDDPYAHKKNIIHSPEEIKQLVSTTQKASPDIARKLGRIISACYHVGHALYSDMHPTIVYDNFAPYDVADVYGPGHSVIIKDFGNLRAKEIWPESKHSPCDHIRIICVYKNVSPAVDSVSHITYDGDPIHGLVRAAIYVDGVEKTIDESYELAIALENVAITIFQKSQSADLEFKKKQYYSAKAYTFKKLAEVLGRDWHEPIPGMMAAAQGKVLYSMNWPEDKESIGTVVRSYLDPRIVTAENLY